MSITRIWSVLLQELYITKRSYEVLIDLFYFSVITVVVYGFVSVYLTGEINSDGAHYLILGMLLWEIIRVVQYTLTMGSLWNVWSRNLSNMFVAPLSVKEYIFAHMLSGVLKALIIFILISVIATYIFNFNIFQLGFGNLALFFINLTLFAWSIGIVLLGAIFRFGTRIQAFAWSIVFLFQPLTANVYPLTVLPAPMQKFALILPPTHIFEAARRGLHNPAINWQLIGLATFENIVFIVLSFWIFKKFFDKSRETGQFARNEG